MTALARIPAIHDNCSLDFIHVGLGKCASTYLQGLWGADPRYIYMDGSSLVQNVRTAAESGPDARLHVTPPHRGPTSTTVLSSEGFSWGWINAPVKQFAVANLHKVAARTLGKACLSNRVLIVVRNPVDWLRAVHEQSIKEGGYASFATFIKEQELLCRSVLDLSLILECYRKYFATVVVLSTDELRRTPEQFWQAYEHSLAVPIPSDDAIAHAQKFTRNGNSGLGDRVAVLAAMNRHSLALSSAYKNLSGFEETFPSEYALMKSLVSEGWVWPNRRVAEFGSDEQLAEIASHLAPTNLAEFCHAPVSRALGEWIAKRFIEPLDTIDTVSAQTVAGYRDALAAARE